MFVFKKVFSRLFFPIPGSLEILLLGLTLLWFTRRQKAGKIAVTFGTSIFLVLSLPWCSNLLLEPLERQFSPLVLEGDSSRAAKARTAKYIVVLTGGDSPDKWVDSASRLGADTLYRLINGIELYREIPGAKLVLSGAAEAMADVACSLGVPRDRLIFETKGRDTEEEALDLKPLLGGVPFILVTSAAHMPRAMRLFQKLQMDPLPAPTDYRAKGTDPIDPDGYYPTSRALGRSETVVYERLGMIWARIWGKV
jgi:uncharacterized SAM-binding protein YcdF (DUF218 family)